MQLNEGFLKPKTDAKVSYLRGYWSALKDSASWNCGIKVIGCARRPIHDVMKQEISRVMIEVRIETGVHPSHIQPIFLNEFQDVYMGCLQ